MTAITHPPHQRGAADQKSMMEGFSRLIVAGLVLMALAALVPTYPEAGDGSLALIVWFAGVAVVGITGYIATRIIARDSDHLDALALRQASAIDRLPDRLIPTAIVGYSAVSLFLELAMIRWQGGGIPILAFYKNFSLLAALAGLGLGYALHARRHVPLFATIPVLSLQLAFFWLIRRPGTGGFVNPFAEQSTIGLRHAMGWAETLGSYSTLGAVVLTTALAFVPIGQVVGRFMARRANLRSYGLNLVGSLGGVLAMFVLSALWVPAWVWFTVSFAGLLPVLALKKVGVTVTILIAASATLIIATPGDRGTEVIYSPYQVLEYSELGAGDLQLRSAGHFLLTAMDLSPPALADDPQREELAAYYEFPFLAADRVEDVLIVGSGAGNDVAAALRSGASRLDAVEIDPAITALGAERHPEKPFENSRVTAITADARAHLADPNNSYDLIVFGLLDSHSVASHGSNVRLDSFVYTVEGLTQARKRLNPGGIVTLGFLAFTPELNEKLYNMLTEAFEGNPPVVLRSESSPTYVFVSSLQGSPDLSTSLLERSDLVDVSDEVAGANLRTAVATDDWPFLYMARPTFPTSYLYMAALILGSLYLMFRRMSHGGFETGNLGFFFLGAGFLLVETKGITELGLAFGNTWEVVGIVIAAILVMAYLANFVASRFQLSLKPVLVALLLTIGLGYVASATGVVANTGMGKWMSLVLLTVPVFFSGLAFSLGLSMAATVSGVLAVNLIGAIVGGLLEYTTLMVGYRALYLVALVVYGVGGVLLLRMKARSQTVS